MLHGIQAMNAWIVAMLLMVSCSGQQRAQPAACPVGERDCGKCLDAAVNISLDLQRIYPGSSFVTGFGTWCWWCVTDRVSNTGYCTRVVAGKRDDPNLNATVPGCSNLGPPPYDDIWWGFTSTKRYSCPNPYVLSSADDGCAQHTECSRCTSSTPVNTTAACQWCSDAGVGYCGRCAPAEQIPCAVSVADRPETLLMPSYNDVYKSVDLQTMTRHRELTEAWFSVTDCAAANSSSPCLGKWCFQMAPDRTLTNSDRMAYEVRRMRPPRETSSVFTSTVVGLQPVAGQENTWTSDGALVPLRADEAYQFRVTRNTAAEANFILQLDVASSERLTSGCPSQETTSESVLNNKLVLSVAPVNTDLQCDSLQQCDGCRAAEGCKWCSGQCWDQVVDVPCSNFPCSAQELLPGCSATTDCSQCVNRADCSWCGGQCVSKSAATCSNSGYVSPCLTVQLTCSQINDCVSCQAAPSCEFHMQVNAEGIPMGNQGVPGQCAPGNCVNANSAPAQGYAAFPHSYWTGGQESILIVAETCGDLSSQCACLIHQCSFHGTCEPDGSCSCDLFYDGDRCEEQLGISAGQPTVHVTGYEVNTGRQKGPSNAMPAYSGRANTIRFFARSTVTACFAGTIRVWKGGYGDLEQWEFPFGPTEVTVGALAEESRLTNKNAFVVTVPADADILSESGSLMALLTVTDYKPKTGSSCSSNLDAFEASNLKCGPTDQYYTACSFPFSLVPPPATFNLVWWGAERCETESSGFDPGNPCGGLGQYAVRASELPTDQEIQAMIEESIMNVIPTGGAELNVVRGGPPVTEAYGKQLGDYSMEYVCGDSSPFGSGRDYSTLLDDLVSQGGFDSSYHAILIFPTSAFSGGTKGCAIRSSKRSVAQAQHYHIAHEILHGINYKHQIGYKCSLDNVWLEDRPLENVGGMAMNFRHLCTGGQWLYEDRCTTNDTPLSPYEDPQGFPLRCTAKTTISEEMTGEQAMTSFGVRDGVASFYAPDTHDVMTYCLDGVGLSNIYTWGELAASGSRRRTSRRTTTAVSANVDAISIRAHESADGTVGFITHAMMVSVDELSVNPTFANTSLVQLKGRDGSVSLASYPLIPFQRSATGGTWFRAVVRYEPSLRAIEFHGASLGAPRLLDAVQLPPSWNISRTGVALTGARVQAGLLAVNWTVTGPDPSDGFTVRYHRCRSMSPRCASWTVLGLLGGSARQLIISADQVAAPMEAGQGVLQVLARNAFHVQSSTLTNVSIANSAPQLQVRMAPLANYSGHQVVRVSVSAWDREDGNIVDRRAFNWTSSGSNGRLSALLSASGAHLGVRALSFVPGGSCVHAAGCPVDLRVEARDVGGSAASLSFRFTVSPEQRRVASASPTGGPTGGPTAAPPTPAPTPSPASSIMRAYWPAFISASFLFVLL